MLGPAHGSVQQPAAAEVATSLFAKAIADDEPISLAASNEAMAVDLELEHRPLDVTELLVVV